MRFATPNKKSSLKNVRAVQNLKKPKTIPTHSNHIFIIMFMVKILIWSRVERIKSQTYINTWSICECAHDKRRMPCLSLVTIANYQIKIQSTDCDEKKTPIQRKNAYSSLGWSLINVEQLQQIVKTAQNWQLNTQCSLQLMYRFSVKWREKKNAKHRAIRIETGKARKC